MLHAGLLSLSIEFYRIQAYSCHQDGQGNPISNNPSKFPYGDDTTCGLRCSVGGGPSSPMRQGSANNIYVIPVPRILTFGTATLLAAGCCVHTIVWMASMTDKVFESKWKSRLRLGFGADDTPVDETISGTNGATKKSMKGVNSGIRFFLSVVAVPVFGGAGLAIIIVGEINFFSGPVSYQVEPLASIGECTKLSFLVLALLIAHIANTCIVPLQCKRPVGTHCWNGISCHRISVSCPRSRCRSRQRRDRSSCRSRVQMFPPAP